MESRFVPQVVPDIAFINSQRSRATLHSWKEIAQYLRMGVRTVQRYEAKLGLPVHRVGKKRPGAVFAFCDEVDQWLMLSPTRNSIQAAGACTVFSSLFEALRTHASTCLKCSAAGQDGHDQARMAS